jgi:hypothetical protein
MKTFEIKLNGKTLKATVTIMSACVIVNTEFDGFKRSMSADSISEAAEKTTIVPVKEYLKSLI